MPARDEILDQPDPLTGRRVRRWTSSSTNDQHFYFTSPTVTDDGRWLAIISERSGHPNVHVIDRRDGGVRQLSRNRSGLLHGYVYPTGGEAGLAKASPSLHAASGRVIWIQDDALWTAWVAEDRQPERLCDLPAGWWSSFTDISRCGRYACLAVSEPAAFVDPVPHQYPQLVSVFRRFHAGGLHSRVLLIDCSDGTLIADVAVPFWVSHVNLHPQDHLRVLINSESTLAAQRMWRLRLDSGHLEPLFPQSSEEYVTHENWDSAGTSIVSHGWKRAGGESWVERRDWDGRQLERLSTPTQAFFHATLTPDGHFVTDSEDGTIAIWKPGDDAPRVLCQHGSSFAHQDSHPHPRACPDGRSVVFTSNREGTCNVYEVDIAG